MIILIMTLSGVQPAFAAAPLSDNFGSPTVIGGLFFSDFVDITEATTETDEPQNCGVMDRTVWYSFTPTDNEVVEASTESIAIASNLNVYTETGSGISDLHFLGCTGGSAVPIIFNAQAGKTYYFQAGGLNGEFGSISISWLRGAANDGFANATVIPPSPLPFDDHLIDTFWATSEQDEPQPEHFKLCPGIIFKTVWYSFTPTTSGLISASWNLRQFTPTMTAYTGTSLETLLPVGCRDFRDGGRLFTFHVDAGTTYYIQVGDARNQGGFFSLHLDVSPAPVAGICSSPSDPSVSDTMQFSDCSSDPEQVEGWMVTWNFGDGTTLTIPNPGVTVNHQYAADGDYTVQLALTTLDGRTASTSQVVQVRTHDVAITKITTPNSAHVGQTKPITVTVRSSPYPEMVQVDLYKSTPSGFVWIAAATTSLPALKGNRTTDVNFNYTFVSEDAQIGNVTFKAVVTINGVRDARPSDNEAISSNIKVAK